MNVPVLWSSPAAYQAVHPDVFAAVYGESKPIQCPIAESALRDLQANFPTRITKQGGAAESLQSELVRLEECKLVAAMACDGLAVSD